MLNVQRVGKSKTDLPLHIITLHDFRFYYPFTAPAVNPEIMCRCKIK